MITIEEIASCVAEIEREFQQTPGLILSEDDAKCILFGQIQSKLVAQRQHRLQTADPNIFASPLHTEIKFLDQNGKLTIRPDITLVDPSDLSLNQSRDGFSIQRKGFVFFGSAIAIEIKFCKAKRGITDPFVASVRNDCEKLIELRTRHYPATELPTFKAIVVVFNRSNLCSQGFASLRAEFSAPNSTQLLYATANFTT